MNMATVTNRKAADMALVKVKDRAQITLPPDIRKALNVDVGDYLETEVVEGGVLLKPVAVVERTEAWDALFKVLEGVRYQGPEPRPSPEEEERMVAEMIRAYRKERRAKEHA
jgi:AbrB family looped-hinge helix DNA binding protein